MILTFCFPFQRCITVGYYDHLFGSELYPFLKQSIVRLLQFNLIVIIYIDFISKLMNVLFWWVFRLCQQILKSKGSPFPKDKGEDKQNTSNHQWRRWMNWRPKFLIASDKRELFFNTFPPSGELKEKNSNKGNHW